MKPAAWSQMAAAEAQSEAELATHKLSKSRGNPRSFYCQFN